MSPCFAVFPVFWFLGLSCLSFCLDFFSRDVPTCEAEGGNLGSAESGENGPANRNRRRCRKCNVAQPRGAEHCEFCDVCIEGLDHHCPWMGKCIGKKSVGKFYVFIVVSFASLCYIFFDSMMSEPARKSYDVHSIG